MGLLEQTLRGRSLADYTNSELKIALNTALYTNTADMWSRYLVQQGYSGSVADMMAKWWADNKVPAQFRNYINSGLYLFNPSNLFAAIINDAGELAPYVTFTRSSTATYYGSDGLLKTAAENEPRYDYDPVTLQLRGLLIEEQRTNQRLYSQDIANSYWSKAAITISSNTEVAPDGTLTADKMAATATSGVHGIYVDGALSAAVRHTISGYFKDAGDRYVIFKTNPSFNKYAGIVADLQSGAITQTVDTGGLGDISASVTAVGNGWYRLSVSWNDSGPAEAASRLTVLNCKTPTYTPGDFGNNNMTGDGVSGVLVWGLQLEAGAFATSYIPTTTAAVTRAADACGVTNLANIGLNASEGTLFVEATPSLAPAFEAFVRMAVLLYDNVGYSNALRLERVIGDFRDVQTVSGASSLTTAGWATGTTAKIAAAYANSNSAVSFNGSSPASIGGGVPSGLVELGIGGNASGGNNWCGHIRRLRYYPNRLTNANLQALTA